jgi:hypothetical protein
MAIDFIRSHSSAFSTSDFDLGRTTLVQHKIDTGDNRPFKQALRRHPIAQLPIIDEHVERMLKSDVIEPAVSPWSSNIVLIRKRDQSLRFCLDYRQLNGLTRKDAYPLPRTEDCLRSLGNAKFLSTLDLRSGYWQAEILPEDRDKTSFITRKGQWRFKVLSFGLANAPGLFQRLMDRVLAGLTWDTCLVFLDDIIVYSSTFEEHAQRLDAVFQRVAAAGLKLHPQKCRLFQRKVTFLGHVVSEEGIAPDPDKISAVQTWPRPRNLTEVRAFVGLCSYYRSHVPNFAEVAQPLHALTKKHAAFCWSEDQEQAFQELKAALIRAPVLVSPLEEGKYVVDCDASGVAVSAILHQEQAGEMRVVAYASRCLD